MKNNKNIIILLITIIIILILLLVLFSTNIISFNKNYNNVNINENDNSQKQESTIVGYYQNIVNYASDSYNIYEFKLNADNTVDYIIGHSHNENYNDADISMNYSGTYLEKDNEVILSIISTDDKCEESKYECKDIIILSKQNDNVLINNNEQVKETFNKVDSLLLIK